MKYRIIVFVALLTVLGNCGKNENEEETGAFPKTVLIELFTNVYCVNCPMADAFADSMVETGKAVAIKYHSPLYNPLDPFSGPPADEDIRTRENFYFGSSSHGYPYIFFDGVLGNEGIGGIEGWSNQIDSRISEGSDVQIHLSGHRSGQRGEIQVVLDGEYSGKTLRVALVESGLEFEADTYNFVLRRFIPDANGIRLVQDSNTITIPFELDGDWDPEHIAFVAFVQDDSDKEVEQASMILWNELVEDTTAMSQADLIPMDTLYLTTSSSMVYARMWLKNIGTAADSFRVVVYGALPPDWFKMLCIGPTCLPDSTGITPTLEPNDSIDLSVEVYAATADSVELTVKAMKVDASTVDDSVKFRIISQ